MAADQEIHAVTGAFGYTGRYIARRLLGEGRRVRTLTNSVDRAGPLRGEIEVHPLCFEDPKRLAAALQGVSVLYNTYWVRFNHRAFTFAAAVKNSLTLFDAARRAGVERIVHLSITNPSEESELEYFRGKAVLERELGQSGLSHAILRPAVIFGREDILINNIAWVLRRLPVFGIFGDGLYRLRPIDVEDLAALAVAEGRNNKNVVIDAVGPETFTYRALVQTIGESIGKKRRIVSVPPFVAYAAGALIGAALGDVLITRDEVRGLMAELLFVDSPPAGGTRLTDWVRENAGSLGVRYASELARRLT